MKKYIKLVVLILITSNCFCQDEKQSFGDQIFLPAIDIGYLFHQSDQLSGGIIIKTSVEYRFRSINDFFLRLNYDTHDAEFNLDDLSVTTNIIKGKASLTDLLLGVGYRLGGEKIRYILMIQPGIRLYNFPNATQDGNTIVIEQESDNVWTTRATIGLEYYLDKKAALSLDLFQSQVWQDRSVWRDHRGAFGFSVGIITALF